MAESQETKLDPSAPDFEGENGQGNMVVDTHKDQTANTTHLEDSRQDLGTGISSSLGMSQKSPVDDNMLDETPGTAVELVTAMTPERTPVPFLADSNEFPSSPVIADSGDDWVSCSDTPDPFSQDLSGSGSVAHPSGSFDSAAVGARFGADRKSRKELEKLTKSSWILKKSLKKAHPEAQKKPRSKAKIPKSKKGMVRLEDCTGRKFIFPFDACKTWEGMSKLVSAAVRIDDPNRRMVELGFYYLLGPDGSIILPSTWEEVIEPGWSLTIQMWPMQNDKVDDDRPNTKLIGSSELGYTHKTQFENVDPLNPYFHRSNPGFVESLNAPEEVQSAAAFSKGSNTESMDPRAVHALDSHAGSPHTGVAPSRKSRSESISWDHPINDQSSEASRPISAQREGTTPKGKQPLNVGSNDWGSWGLKQSSATQLRHGQSKNKVAQPDVSFEKESQEPQTPAKSGAPANVENLIQPHPQKPHDTASHAQPPPLPQQSNFHPGTNQYWSPSQYWNPSFSAAYGHQPWVPPGGPPEFLPYKYNQYPPQPILPEDPSTPPPPSFPSYFQPPSSFPSYFQPPPPSSFPANFQPQPPYIEPQHVPQLVRTSAANPDIPTTSKLSPTPKASSKRSKRATTISKRVKTIAPTSTDAEIEKHRKPQVSQGQSSSQSRKLQSSTDAHQSSHPGDFFFYSSASEEQDYPEQTFTWRKIERMPRKERRAFYRQNVKDYKAKFAPHNASEMKHKELSGDFAKAFPNLFNETAADSWNDIGLTDGVLQQLMIALFSPTPSRYWTAGMQLNQTEYERSQYLGLVQTLRRLEKVNKEIGCTDGFFPTMVLMLIHLGYASWEMASWSHKQKSGSALDCPMWKIQNLCYRRKVLTQPGHTGDEKHLGQLHRNYIYAVFCAMNYKASEIDLIKWSEIKWTAEDAKLSVSDVMVRALDKQAASHRALSQTQDALFEARHLSIKALLEIGKIEIKWTLSLNEHLRLTNAANGKRMLHILWDPTLLWMIHGYFDDLYRWPELVELKRTYAILFSPSRTAALPDQDDAPNLPETDIEASEKSKSFNFGATHNEYDISESYRLLPTPPHYQVSKEKIPGKNNMKKCPTYLQAIQMHHEAAMTTTLNEMETFEIYVVFGDRLREIHFHMNKSRPRGIFGLWRDRRDSLAWYTLWAALAFGSVSLFLALSSVIISAIQTKAAFEALRNSSTET